MRINFRPTVRRGVEPPSRLSAATTLLRGLRCSLGFVACVPLGVGDQGSRQSCFRAELFDDADMDVFPRGGEDLVCAGFLGLASGIGVNLKANDAFRGNKLMG